MVRLTAGKFKREVNRGMWRLIAIAMIVAGAAAGPACSSSPAGPQAAPADASAQPTRVPGEYLVTLFAPAEVKAISDLYGRFGIKGIQLLGANIYLITLTDDPGPATMESLRTGNAYVKTVEPNYMVRTQGGGSAR
jgi:hypothetical protein